MKTLLYFEVITTPLALVIALVVVNVMQPGAGINADAATLDASAVAAYASGAEQLTTVGFILNIIPTTLVEAFARGEILQVLLVSVLFGLALLYLGERGRPLVALHRSVFTGALRHRRPSIMRVAPIGAFGAMAFTIGTYGIETLLSLGKLMAAFYLACALFIFVGMGIDRPRLRVSTSGSSCRYIKEEILIVLGTGIVRVGAAAPDGEAREARLPQACGRPGGADGILDEPRWHVDLHGDGVDLHRAGDEHVAPARAAAGPARRCCC